MAQICSFFGIVIWMYYNDHNPPHFHAVYGEFDVEIAIKNFEVLEGYLPPRTLGLVMEWQNCIKQNFLQTGNYYMKARNQEK